VIHFTFPNGIELQSRILAAEPPEVFALTYFGGSKVVFRIAPDGGGGCDLSLTDSADDAETVAGWVSVLLALKAAVDFGVDLRNHDERRTWSQGYADN
jgi:hypothetical protein